MNYIPEEIVFFLQKEIQVNGHKGTPAFPVSRETVDKKGTTWENAKSWANRYRPRQTAMPTLGEALVKMEGGTPRPKAPLPDEEAGIGHPNIPQTGYRIVNAEQRGQGGRAWKVITPEGYIVDLREDVFLPILLKKGLPKTGLIPSQLQWCVAGGHIRLEEVGSLAFKKYIPTDQVEAHKAAQVKKHKAIPRVKVKDLVVGGVYNFNGLGYYNSSRLYMGRARVDGKLHTVWISIKNKPHQKTWDNYVEAAATPRHWKMFGYLLTGSRATHRIEGDVVVKDGWKDLVEWYGSGDRYIHSIAITWPE